MNGDNKIPYTVVEDDAIWHYPVNQDGSKYLAPIRLCDEFAVVGHGGAENGLQYHVLEFNGDDHCIIARGEVGTSDGWRMLRNVIKIPSQRRKLDLLTEYIQENSDDVPEWRITDTAGWKDNAYVLPNGDIIASGDTEHLYFNGKISGNKRVSYKAAGSLDEWKQQIGRYANGNSRLCLMIGAALVAPLLEWFNIDGGILHLYGNSSTGKTTAQRVAQSIWGHGVAAIEQWNATSLATLNNAFARNDGLLVMDEIGSDDGRNVERSIYALANGQSRAQSTPDAGNRPEIRFRVMTISSGETTLEAHLVKHGRVAMAGQLVRCPSIPHLLETYHDFNCMRDFTNHLNDAVVKYYGTVGRAYINKLLENFSNNKNKVTEYYERYLGKLNSEHELSSQSARTARLFAASMAAAKLASEWNLTGIEADKALNGIEKCFTDWLDDMPSKNNQSYEESSIIQDAINYMQANERSFQSPDFPGVCSYEFPGYVVKGDCDDEDDFYYVFQKIFKEKFCANHDEKQVKELLYELNWLRKAEEKRWVKQLYGKNSVGNKRRLGRFYVFMGIEPKQDEDE